MNHETLTRRGLLRQAAGAAALVSALHAQNQPATSAARIRESFDFGWKFLKGDSPGAQQPEFSDSAWRAVDLPHDWSIEGPFSEQEKAQGSLPTGESRWPGKGTSAGIIDTCGFKKDGFYFYQSQWTDNPVLQLFPHWNWKGREGQFIPVTCYTNCDTVELFLNGRSVGLKGYAFPRLGMEGRYGNSPARARVPRTTGDLHLEWDVPYEPGTLKAAGTKDGKVVSTVEVSTTGEASAIRLTVDRAQLACDRRDVAHITVEILDAQGRVVPTADHEIGFVVEGEGKLIGLDNGDPQSHEDYKSARRKAFNGLCLAIVESTAKSGRIQVTATSPSLQSANLTIATRAMP
jgi:beta-galactosidase